MPPTWQGVVLISCLVRPAAKELLKHWAQHGLAPKRLKTESPELDEACVDLWCTRFLDEKQQAHVKDAAVGAKLSAINDARRQEGWHELPLPSTAMAG